MCSMLFTILCLSLVFRNRIIEHEGGGISGLFNCSVRFLICNYQPNICLYTIVNSSKAVLAVCLLLAGEFLDAKLWGV